MNKSIDEVEFTIFDTETTGLDPSSGDRIVEIAGIRFRGRDKIADFQTLVNPHRHISSAAFEVNKITQGMLESAPETAQVLPKFMDFVKDSCLCSYNSAFDMQFLNNELRLAGQAFPPANAVADILKMARRILPGLERYSLWFVASKLGIKSGQKHRAFSDVELTLGVFNRLKEMMAAKGITDFTSFLGLFGMNPRLLEDINNQKLAKIQEAMGLGVKLKIKYISSSSAAVSERDIIPKEIRQDKDKSYLVGYCCLRNEERTFRIDGILHIEVV